MSEYPANITLLSQLNELIPTDTETNNKWPASDRQIKAFLQTFLDVTFNDNGSIKDGAVGAGAIADDSIDGTTKIVHGTVDTAAIADGSITHNKLAGSVVTEFTPAEPAPVDTENIVPGAVTTDIIKDRAVTSIKIGIGVVTGPADPTTHVALGNIAVNTIDAQCLLYGSTSTSAPKIPVCAGTNSAMMAVGGVLTATVVAGVLTFAFNSANTADSSKYIKFDRKSTLTTALEDTVYYPLLQRTYKGWAQAAGYTSTIVTIDADTRYFKFVEAGTYIIKLSVPVFAINGHRAVFMKKGTLVDTDWVDTEYIAFGNSNYDGYSELSCMIVTTAANAEYAVHTQYAVSGGETPLFGLAIGSILDNSTYGTIEIQKL